MIDSKGALRRGVITTWWRVSKIGVADQSPSSKALLMDADLDTLATALYVKIDQLLLDAPERLPWRPRGGLTPRISDAEAISLRVRQALLSFTSEARWLHHAHADLRHLFPDLPQQPGYNKRLRKLAGPGDWLVPQLRP